MLPTLRVGKNLIQQQNLLEPNLLANRLAQHQQPALLAAHVTKSIQA